MGSAAQRHRRWLREWAGVTMVLAAIALLLSTSRLSWRLDQAWYDAAVMLWTREAPRDVVIVAIDDASLRSIGRWPWRRAVHATAVARISAAGPKAILLDVLLSEADPDPTQDAVLAQALHAARNAVLPVAYDGRELLPHGELAQAAHLGQADAAADADGTLRAVYLQAGTPGHLLPHLALALMDAAGEPPRTTGPVVRAPDRPEAAPATGLALAAAATPWLRDQRMLLSYAGPPGHIAQVSYAALLRGELPPQTFAGKYVLIGSTAAGLGGEVQTPVSEAGRAMPAVEVHANVLDALRSGRFIRPVPPLAAGLVSATLVVAVMSVLWRLKPRAALLFALGSAAAAMLGALALFGAGIWLPPTSFALAAVLAYPAWSWRQLEATSRYLANELAVLAAEPGLTAAARPGNDCVAAAPSHARLDVMEHKLESVAAATAQLRSARRFLADVLGALPESVFVVNQQGRVLQANREACALLNLSAEPADLVGQPVGTLLTRLQPTEAPHWQMLLARCTATGEVVTTEARFSGGNTNVLARIAPLHDNLGQACGLTICLTDVTPLRLAERQRDELLGFIAHDIRSPQASLISLVELNRMSAGFMNQEELLGHVDSLARNALQLCDELLQLMRAETRPVLRVPADLLSIAEAAMREVSPQAQTKHVVVTKTWHRDATAPLLAEPTLLRRALVNLLSNAVKFSPNASTVTMKITRREGYFVAAVLDQGPGIARSDLPKLFHRYQRLEGSQAARMSSGIGLGLVFIETVARRHGGHVHVESELGHGSCFELWVPADMDDAAAHAADEAHAAGPQT